jgi:hypothetical protein
VAHWCAAAQSRPYGGPVSCPTCGGTRRRTLAPGFFECQSPVTVVQRGPGFGPPPTGQFGPATIMSSTTCGIRYQEGGTVSGVMLCSSNCGRFSVGLCAHCGQPVCGICSPDNGPLLCTSDREALGRAQISARKAAEHKAASTPEARMEQARRLSAEHYGAFIEQWKREQQTSSERWFEETADVLRTSLAPLASAASQALRSVVVERSFGRSNATQGWRFATYSQESGNERLPSNSTPLDFLLCVDGFVRVAASGESPAIVKKWRAPIDLAKARAQQVGTAFDSREAMIAFHYTAGVRWEIDAALGKGAWHELVLADLAQ